MRDLIKAADKNRRTDIVVEVQGVAVAVIHGLDSAFNKGKAKILQKYIKALTKPPKKSKDVKQAGNQLLSLIQGLNQKGAKKSGN